MTAPFQLCAHCGQYIATNTSHFVVIETADQQKHYLHYNPCMQRFIEDNPSAFIVQEHVNHHRR